MAAPSPSSSPSPAQFLMGFRPIVEPTARWVRVQFGAQIIADSKRALLLIQYGPGKLPTYYFPQGDVRMDVLEPATSDAQSDGRIFYRVVVGDKVADGAAWIYED